MYFRHFHHTHHSIVRCQMSSKIKSRMSFNSKHYVLPFFLTLNFEGRRTLYISCLWLAVPAADIAAQQFNTYFAPQGSCIAVVGHYTSLWCLESEIDNGIIQTKMISLKILCFKLIYIIINGVMNFKLQYSSVTLFQSVLCTFNGFLHFVLSHVYRWPWLQDEVHWLLEGESQIIFDHIWWVGSF